MNIQDLIAKAIHARTTEIIDEEAKEAAVRVEKRVRGEVGKIAAEVLTRFSYEQRGPELLIRVEFNETKQ